MKNIEKPTSLSENERRLVRLEEAWQKKRKKNRAEEQLEWAHPHDTKTSYAFMNANNIHWELVDACPANATYIEEDCENYYRWCRHDMSREDWADDQHLVHLQQHFIRNSGEDYDHYGIFGALKFKIDRMIDYWRQFSHLRDGDSIRSQMELASRLLQIILKKGNEASFLHHLTNKERFEVRFHASGFYVGEEPEVRHKKLITCYSKCLKNTLHCKYNSNQI